MSESQPITTTAAALRAVADADDRAAWAWLVEHHAAEVHRTVLRAIRNPTLAEDAVQETFLQLRGVAGRFQPGTGDGEPRARAWIHRIAGNCALMLLRGELRRRDRDRRAGTGARGGPAMDADHVDREAVHLTLAALPERQRHPLVLRYFAGLDDSELATALGCTVNAARVRVHRALKGLRRALVRRGVGVAGCAALATALEVGAAEAVAVPAGLAARVLVAADAAPRLAVATASLTGGSSLMLPAAALALAAVVAAGATVAAVAGDAPTPPAPADPPVAVPAEVAPLPEVAEDIRLLGESRRLERLADQMVADHGGPLVDPGGAEARKRFAGLLAAEAHFRAGRHAECLAGLERALREDRMSSPQHNLLRGLALEGLDRPDEALAAYAQLVERSPDALALVPVALVRTALLHLAAGRWRECRATCRRFDEREDWQAHDSLAFLVAGHLPPGWSTRAGDPRFGDLAGALYRAAAACEQLAWPSVAERFAVGVDTPARIVELSLRGGAIPEAIAMLDWLILEVQRGWVAASSADGQELLRVKVDGWLTAARDDRQALEALLPLAWAGAQPSQRDPSFQQEPSWNTIVVGAGRWLFRNVEAHPRRHRWGLMAGIGSFRLGDYDACDSLVGELEADAAVDVELRAQALYWIGYGKYLRAATAAGTPIGKAGEQAGWDASLPTHLQVLERYPDTKWAASVKRMLEANGKLGPAPATSARPSGAPAVPASVDDF